MVSARASRQRSQGGDRPSPFELCVYVVAGLHVLAGGYIAATGRLPVDPGISGPRVRLLLAAGVSAGPSVLVLLGALGLRRTAYPDPDWRHVGGWYLAGVGVGAATLAWLVVGTGPADPVPVPGELRATWLVVAGGLGGASGFVLGAWRGRAARSRHAPARLLATGDQAAWLFDPEHSETLYVNPAYERLFGQDTEELVDDPRAVIEVVHPDDREALRDGFDRLADGDPVEFELRANPDDGFGRWVWLSGWPVTDGDDRDTVACVARDVTSRRTHRERLVRLHDATRELFRAETEEEAARKATDAAEEVLGLRLNTIWLHDDERDELISTAASAAAEAASRPLPRFKTGTRLAREVYESGEPQVFNEVRVAPGGPNAPTRSEMVLPLGEYGVFMAGSTTTGPLENWQVSLGKVLAANVEVALARIEGTRELEESRRALERRNERLDEFTSVVSHDLRNPLAVARGHLDLVGEECDHESVETIDSALDRMGTLIDDLLTLAREGEAIDEPQSFDLGDHVRDCWAGVETGEARLAVETDTTIEADPSRLTQLFENLFRNAVEHGTTADDPVTVTVGSLPRGFYVEDDGPGIPPEKRGSVFEAGYTTEREGTGFGLSIVQTIAEAHGWDIEVTEGSGGGARFEVTGVTVY